MQVHVSVSASSPIIHTEVQLLSSPGHAGLADLAALVRTLVLHPRPPLSSRQLQQWYWRTAAAAKTALQRPAGNAGTMDQLSHEFWPRLQMQLTHAAQLAQAVLKLPR